MKTFDNQDSAEFTQIVMNEHKAYVQNLRAAGLEVTEYPGIRDDAPDAVFPDWFCTYKGESIPEGVLIICPMKYQSRRDERVPELIERLSASYKHTIDLTHFEEKGLALEGKGSIVFDHRNRRFYIILSNRACQEVIDELVTQWNRLCVDGDTNPYEAITFVARDANKEVIYHTDCMLTLHGHHALVCLESITDPEQKAMVIRSLTDPANPWPYEIMDVSYE
jgi:hypothetical protein